MFCQIEGCPNSRLLCQLTNDPKATLTPGHFLTGAPLLVFPDDSTNNMLGRTKRWELIQKLVHIHWRRWQTEYIANLQPRTKRFNSSSDIFKVNDFVLVSELCNPANWSMARILKLHADNSKVFRVVYYFEIAELFSAQELKLRRLHAQN